MKVSRKSSLSLVAAMFACSAIHQSARADNQQTTPAAGTVDGSSVSSFFGSGAAVNPMAMEQASVVADRDVNLGPDHKVKALTPEEAAKQARGGGVMGGLDRAVGHTANFIGLPIGDDSIDHGVDASLSSDMQNEKNRASNTRLKQQLIAEDKSQKVQEKAAKEETKEASKEVKLEKTISGKSSKSESAEAKKAT